jgi:hypothetical protein
LNRWLWVSSLSAKLYETTQHCMKGLTTEADPLGLPSPSAHCNGQFEAVSGLCFITKLGGIFQWRMKPAPSTPWETVYVESRERACWVVPPHIHMPLEALSAQESSLGVSRLCDGTKNGIPGHRSYRDSAEYRPSAMSWTLSPLVQERYQAHEASTHFHQSDAHFEHHMLSFVELYILRFNGHEHGHQSQGTSSGHRSISQCSDVGSLR